MTYMLLSISFKRYNNSIIERAQAPTIFDYSGQLMRFKVANYSRLEIRLDTLHIYKSGGHIKKISAGAALCPPPHLQIASDATAIATLCGVVPMQIDQKDTYGRVNSFTAITGSHIATELSNVSVQSICFTFRRSTCNERIVNKFHLKYHRPTVESSSQAICYGRVLFSGNKRAMGNARLQAYVNIP